MWRIGILLISCGLLSCVTSEDHVEPTPRPNELYALTTVWDVYFQAEVDPPTVIWWDEPCPDDSACLDTAVVIQGICYAGYFRPHLWQADVAWRGRFSQSAYVHELTHAWQATRGVFDANHESDEWMLVDLINADLANVGL